MANNSLYLFFGRGPSWSCRKMPQSRILGPPGFWMSHSRMAKSPSSFPWTHQLKCRNNSSTYCGVMPVPTMAMAVKAAFLRFCVIGSGSPVSHWWFRWSSAMTFPLPPLLCFCHLEARNWLSHPASRSCRSSRAVVVITICAKICLDWVVISISSRFQAISRISNPNCTDNPPARIVSQSDPYSCFKSVNYTKLRIIPWRT